MNRTKKLMELSMLSAIAVLFHMIESYIVLPLPITMAGFKLGLANLVGLVALYRFGTKEMFMVNILRVLLASLLRGTIFSVSFLMSFSGVITATFVMMFLFKKSPFSIYGVSIAGAVMHTFAQVSCISLLYSQMGMFILFPTLMQLSMCTGLFNAYLSVQVIKRLK